MRETRTLRAMWRALETGLRQLLNGHEEGNPGYKPRRNLRATAPALDPTRVRKRHLKEATRGADATCAHRQGGRLHWGLYAPQDGPMTRLPKMMLDELEVARKPTRLKSREQFEV